MPGVLDDRYDGSSDSPRLRYNYLLLGPLVNEYPVHSAKRSVKPNLLTDDNVPGPSCVNIEAYPHNFEYCSPVGNVSGGTFHRGILVFLADAVFPAMSLRLIPDNSYS